MILCLSTHIYYNCISFEDKHGYTNVAKELRDIKDLHFTWNLFIFAQLFEQKAEHHSHSYESQTDAGHREVAEEGVSLNPADGEGGQCH